MQLYPAIDMKDGRCVRLTQGLFHDIKVYSDTPSKVAGYWEEQGATYLHLVDLDGALAGYSVNEGAIKEIIKTVTIPIELGGGIRTAEDIERALNWGISRVIIGTKAVEHPEFIKQMVTTFGADKIVAGIDAKNSLVAIEGWEKLSTITAMDLCIKMKAYGIEHVVYTDIAKDGMLAGPNINYTKELTEATNMNIIASGGVSSLDDLNNLMNAHIKGAIIGKALYENRFTLKDAITLCQ